MTEPSNFHIHLFSLLHLTGIERKELSKRVYCSLVGTSFFFKGILQIEASAHGWFLLVLLLI